MPSPLATVRDPYTGLNRVLGNRPSPPGLVRSTRPAPRLDPATLVEFEHATPLAVKNQGQYGACNGHAAASSEELARWIAGLSHVELSAWYVYAILCRGRDVGSSIAEALDLLRITGTCRDALVPHGTINPARLPVESKADSPRFRVEAGARITSFEAMLAATALNRPGNFSLCADGFGQRLDADGCPAYSPGGCNHAVTYGFGLRKSRRTGEWLIKCLNSWGEEWGLDGYFWIRKQHVDRAPYFDAYEVIATEYDPQDPDNPPVAVDGGPGLPDGRRPA